MHTTRKPSIVAGITTFPPVPVYPVIVTVTIDTVFVKSPDWRAKADGDRIKRLINEGNNIDFQNCI
jgi:hypothetical protein